MCWLVCRVNGVLFMLAGLIHGICHAVGTFPSLSSVSQASDLDGLLYTNPFTEVPKLYQLWLLSIPGVTGIVMWACFLVMAVTSHPRFRNAHYNTFWYLILCLLATWSLSCAQLLLMAFVCTTCMLQDYASLVHHRCCVSRHPWHARVAAATAVLVCRMCANHNLRAGARYMTPIEQTCLS
jgi:hypothetical protein